MFLQSGLFHFLTFLFSCSYILEEKKESEFFLLVVDYEWYYNSQFSCLEEEEGEEEEKEEKKEEERRRRRKKKKKKTKTGINIIINRSLRGLPVYSRTLCAHLCCVYTLYKASDSTTPRQA